MRGLIRLTITNLKLYIREPVSVFFTLAFAPLLVVLFGAMYGNDPSPLFGGYGSMDISMPAYTALILGSVGILGIPIQVGSLREQGVLRRYRTTPMNPLTYITADVITNLIMTLLGMILLVLVGWLLYSVQFEGQVLKVIGALILGGLSMFSFGYLIAGLAPGARAAQVIGMVIFYPMMFLSGAGIPLEIMPETVRKISDFLPLTYVVKLLRGLWFGGSWGEHLLEVAVLVGVLVLCGALTARFFRWE
ncbi:MAG TPA: ABC transporter permease [Anaerolineae bacterium]|nr:ABC transporter permease [Anaerolineae bacterium]